MAELIPNNFESRIFLGELADKKLVERVNETANKIHSERILRPIDVSDARRAEGWAVKMVSDLKGGADNVEGLQRKLVGGTADEQNKASQALMVLEKSVFIAGLYGGKDDDDLVAAISTGDAGRVNSLLPSALEGLGERVVSNIVQNDEVRVVLRKLDGIREKVKVGPILKKKIEASVEELLELSGLDTEGEREVQMACTYLSMELMGEEEGRGRPVGPLPQRPPDLVPPRPPRDDEEGSGRWGEQRSYDMLYETFVRNERNQADPQWYNARPPEWFLDMDETQKSIIETRVRYAEAAAKKREVRNTLPVEKLRTIVPEVRLVDFMRLWEKMPGYRNAMGEIVRAFCGDRLHVGQDGIMSLRLEGKNGLTAGGDVEKWLNNFDNFREEMATRISTSLDLSKEQGDAAVSAAWNHLFMGDFIESADFYRQLTPTEVVSDKFRTFYHLWTKGLGKFGVWKIAGVDSGSGKEEPFLAPDMAEWVADRIQNEQGFKAKLMPGGELSEFLPETLAVSQLETQKVKLKNGRETTLAVVLLEGLEEEVETMTMKGDGSIFQDHNDMLQAVDFLASAIKGKQPLDVGKGGGEWISVFNESTALIRQQDMLPKLMPDGTVGKGHLGFVDNPRFYWSILLCAIGFTPEQQFPILPTEKLGREATENNYMLMVRELVEKVTIRLPVEIKNDVRNKARKMLGGENLLDPIKRGIQNSKDALQRASGKKGRR